MSYFETYCRIQQYFIQIRRQCVFICFKFSGRYKNCSDYMEKVSRQCTEWMNCAARGYYRSCLVGYKYRDSVNVLEPQDSALFNEKEKERGPELQNQQDCLSLILADAYRPKSEKNYMNEFPYIMSRAEFGSWKAGENPYFGLQNIQEDRNFKKSLGNNEICALFFQVKSILSEEKDWETLEMKLRNFFLSYGVKL